MEVLHVPPTGDRRFHLLSTLGMSRQPMNVPEGAEDYRFAELTLCLPERWAASDVRTATGEVTELTWPLFHLVSLAQTIHRFGS